MVEVAGAPPGFSDWDGLHALVRAAFAAMEGRIDPPSSLIAMTSADLAAKARAEVLWLAHDEGRLVGCLFGARQGEALYLSKLAVAPARKGRGIGRALVDAAAGHARATGATALTLGARIELTENHVAFARMGFVVTGASAHPGFDRPTSLDMRCELGPAWK